MEPTASSSDVIDPFARQALLKLALASLPFGERFTDEELESLYAKGYADFQRGDMNGAFDAFRLLAVARPGRAKYLRALAVVHLELGRHEQALVAFTSLRILEPDEPRHRVDIGECLLHQARIEEARAVLDDVIARHGSSAAIPVIEKARALRALLASRRPDAVAT